MKYMPNTMATLADKGVYYNFAHVSTTLCCPSRAAIYTGQYNCRNGVKHNRFWLKGSTIFDDLKDKYYTGLIGKYLNTWDIGRPLPPMNMSVVSPRGGAKYFRHTFYINRKKKTFRGKSNSVVISRYAKQFISAASKQNKPYFLIAAFAAPHAPAIPDAIDRGRFANEEVIRLPNYFVRGPNKPRYVTNNRVKPNNTKQDKFVTLQKEALYSLDRALANLYAAIDFSNTIVFYISDNGIFHGEHDLYSKGAPYEEASKVPLIVRYDPLVKTSAVHENLVAHIDITATIYALSGTSPSRIIDGISLVPTFTNNSAVVRESMLIEGWRHLWRAAYRSNHFGWLTNSRLKLIHNENDISEFYDLNADPYEMNNIYYSGQKKAEKNQMQAALEAKLVETRGSITFK